MNEIYDFQGWATRNDIKCSDGRIIRRDAFKHCDGKKVPLVWNHQHHDPENILGHVILENRPEGVYARGKFNDSTKAARAKGLLLHDDITALSIFANQLQQKGPDVVHGIIREVSLVLAGANTGAYVESVLRHSSDGSSFISEDEAVIYSGEDIIREEESEETVDETVEHAATQETKKEDSTVTTEEKKTDKTVEDVFNTLNEEQKTVVYAMIGQALEGSDDEEDSEGGNESMKHNAFEDNNQNNEQTLSHAEIQGIFKDAKGNKSLKEVVEAAGIENLSLKHGVTDIEYLFPDAKNVTNTPTFIQRNMAWVQKVMAGVHKTPFSRIKSIFADITADDARAKGYIKGNEKLNEVFTLLKRTTTPQTIYKKQKLERDDVIDITDFDVVAWIKGEMRMMLDEEIARAILIGDGRLSSSDDKINETNIRPIWKDADLYTIKSEISLAANATFSQRAKAFIQAAIRAREDYTGSGEPTLFTTESLITDCLLMEDGQGRVIYDSITKLATALRVKEIVSVPVMKGQTRTVESKTFTLGGLIVNLQDYNVGADKGGAVNLFDDFDIDFNAMKYLIETRISGALVQPKSAIALEFTVASAG